MNWIDISNTYNKIPDIIGVYFNNIEIYQGPGNVQHLQFMPRPGDNILKVRLLKKSNDNFIFDSTHNERVFDSTVEIKNIVVENRYLRSLLNKCGLVEIDIKKHVNFEQQYLHGATVMTMENSCYSITFPTPIKNWIQLNLHNRVLNNESNSYINIKKELDL
jgi:hypothetical protein